MSRHPNVKWAQRSDRVYITVELPDAQDVKLTLEPEGKFYFSATAGATKAPYEIDLDLFDKVNVEESKASVGSRNICYLVQKAEEKWWDRLLKQGGKPPIFLKVDWDKWVDEDEEQDTGLGADNNMDFGGLDFSKMGMGGGEGLGDFGAGDDVDEDEESEAEEGTTGKESSGNEHLAGATVSNKQGGEPEAKG
ncbi:hypothetical protein K1719_016356 [Acacia pycnantha]|nr:hypothetical protein K1719_016356 [Acacia pycnantha]